MDDYEHIPAEYAIEPKPGCNIGLRQLRSEHGLTLFDTDSVGVWEDWVALAHSILAEDEIRTRQLEGDLG